ncbi:MAG: hypothetical protein ABUL58_01270, partial [Steroidobacter sp.]
MTNIINEPINVHMASQLILLCIDIATIGLIALFGLRVATLYPKRRESWIIVLICMAAISHVALARAEYGPWMAEPYRFYFSDTVPFLNVMRNLAPGLFALLAYFTFTDRRMQPLWLYGLLVVQVILESPPRARSGVMSSAHMLSPWLQITFAAMAIYWTMGYWRGDLIEARRRARAVVSIIVGINVVASSIL